MLKWRSSEMIGTGKPVIVPITIERETDDYVFLAAGDRGFERKHKKRSSMYCYFDSWEEAREHLLAKASIEARRAEMNFRRAESQLNTVLGMTNPLDRL